MSHEHHSRLRNRMETLQSLEQLQKQRRRNQKPENKKPHSTTIFEYTGNLIWGKTRQDQLNRSKIDAAVTFSALTAGTIAICNGNIGLLGESLAISLPTLALFTLHHLGIPERPNWK